MSDEKQGRNFWDVVIHIYPKSRTGQIVFWIIGFLVLGGFGVWRFAPENFSTIVSLFQTTEHGNGGPVISDGILKVAVFYPDPSITGAAYQDGEMQEGGFKKAVEEYPPAQAPRLVKYKFPGQNDGVPFSEDLMPKIKSLYGDGYKIFILTMSAANLGIRDAFVNWSSKYKDTENAPILIATVASSPGVADAEHGIFRFYIRSEDEAAVLAQYAAWKDGLERVGVFYIDDAYGKGGLATFRHAFETDLGGKIKAYDVDRDGLGASERVAEFLKLGDMDRTGAFIVGYDAMLKGTLEELVRQGFSGPILSSSTLSVPTWQPSVSTVGREIVTVVPHRDGPHTIAEENSVFFFSKITLIKALRCANQSRTTKEFRLLWQRPGDEDGGIEVQHLSDGDAIIPVQVSAAWRARNPV